MSTQTQIRPMEHTGDSANIAFYREKGAKTSEPFVWCEVLLSTFGRDPATKKIVSHAPTYHFTVHRGNSMNEIARFKHVGRKQNGTARALSAATVTRLVREHV